MKTTALFLLTLLPLIPAARGEDTPEFDKLQSSYNDAVENATKPLTQKYLQELEKLRDTYTRATNLTGASKVQGEIDTINNKLAFANAAKRAPTAPAAPIPMDRATAKAAVTAGKPPELRWFVDKTWQTDAQTKWSFDRDGTGTKVRGKLKTGIFKWRLLESGILEISDQAAPGAPVTITYLRFTDKHEARFGRSENNLTERLRFP